MLLVRIVSHLRGNLSFFVQDRHASLQLRNDCVIPANVYRCRHPQILLDRFHEIAVQVPIFDAPNIPVTNEQQWFSLSRIESDSMAGFERPFALSRPAE